MNSKFRIILIFSFTFSVFVHAQSLSEKKLNITSYTRIVNLGYNNIDDMLRDNVLPHAAEVNIKNTGAPMMLYASIHFTTSHSPNLHPGIKLSTGQNSFAGSINTEMTFLENAPLKIAIIPPDFLGTLSYDVIQPALKEFVTPGNFPFQIIFTLSSQ